MVASWSSLWVDPVDDHRSDRVAAALYRRAPLAILSTSALAIVTVLSIAGFEPSNAIWAWLGVFVLVQAGRLGDAIRWRRARVAPPAARLIRRYALGAVASCGAWVGLIGIFALFGPDGGRLPVLLGTLALLMGTTLEVGAVRRWALWSGLLLLVPLSVALIAVGAGVDRSPAWLAWLFVLPAGLAVAATQRIEDLEARLDEQVRIGTDAAVAARVRLDELEARLAHERQAAEQARLGLSQHIEVRTAALEGRTRELARQALTDPLTGLPNRKGINAHLLDLFEATAETGGSVHLALLFIDLDHFKEVNDLMGHLAGDAVLRAVAERLRETIPRGAFAARWGGDEFVVVLPALQRAEQQSKVVAEQLRAALSVPVRLEGHLVRIGCCIGVALAPAHGRTPEALVTAADLAVYAAKAEGSGRVRVYDATLAEQASRHHRIAQALPSAVDLGQLQVAYQPIVTLDGTPTHVEALARWWHPQWGAVSPGEFIPVAEASGLIHAMGRWVLRQACLDAARWPGDHPPKVSVNVSAIQVSSGRLVAQVREALAAAGLPARRLAIELTESLPMGGRERVEATLAELRSMGVTLIIDDFGTGYSSLSSLKRLPLSIVKVDHSFTRDVPGEGELLIKATVDVARCFGLEVVAEGVETHAQKARLAALGVDYMQGYLFGRPMPNAEFATWLGLRDGSNNVIVLRA
jgi:diguanylate cyclase (GGDEF)-like protein